MTALRLRFGGESSTFTTVKPFARRGKDIVYAKWRNTHALATQFTIVFCRVMHEVENGENENTLLEKALEAHRFETDKYFKLVEF